MYGKHLFLFLDLCNYYLHFLIQDRRLHQSATAVKDGLRTGMTNGAMKGISREIVSVVRSHCLCSKHNLRLTV